MNTISITIPSSLAPLTTILTQNQTLALAQRYATLSDIAKATPDELQMIPGVGPKKAAQILGAFDLARALSREHVMEQPIMDTPEAVASVLREETRTCEHEKLLVLLLNTRRRLQQIITVADGVLDQILVHPREVFRTAIRSSASAIVLAHNHPSGDPTPSDADIRVTRDLIRAGQLLKIDVLDHVILGRRTLERTRDFVSLRELGHFYSN